MNLKDMTEEELQAYKCPSPKTLEELTDIIKQLTEREHDYGTCVYAMSIAALATFYYVSYRLGVTGFQASCADLEFLKRSRNMESGFRIINYHYLLYPQCLNSEHFPTIEKLEAENKEELGKKALELLNKNPNAHPNVLARWRCLYEASYKGAGE